MSVLLTENLSKRYGARRAVDSLSLELEEGVVCGFLGPNGVGKTTVIRMLMGLLRPSSGRACLFGLDCWKQGDRVRESVGYLPGDLRLYDWLTARVALRLVGRVRGRDLLRSGLALAEELELDPDLRVRAMSRGTRQKLGLVLALAGSPRLVVLDEPTTGLDPIIQNRVLSQLKKLGAQAHTVFFSSHTLSEVERLCDRVVILNRGRAVADSTIEKLRSTAQREVVLRWSSTAAAGSATLPGCLEALERNGTEWRCALNGSPTVLAPWLAAQSLVDFSVGAPNLEGLFHSFYEEGP